MQVSFDRVNQARDQFIALALCTSPRCGACSPARVLSPSAVADALGRGWVLRPWTRLGVLVAPPRPDVLLLTPMSDPRGSWAHVAAVVTPTLGLLGPPRVAVHTTHWGDYSHNRAWVDPSWMISEVGTSRVFCVRDVAAGGRVVQELTPNPRIRHLGSHGIIHRTVGPGLGFHLCDCDDRWITIVGGTRVNKIHIWRRRDHRNIPHATAEGGVFVVSEFLLGGGLVHSVKLTGIDEVSVLYEMVNSRNSDLQWIHIDIAQSIKGGVLLRDVISSWDSPFSDRLKLNRAQVFSRELLLTDKHELVSPSGEVVRVLPAAPWLIDQYHFACIDSVSESTSSSINVFNFSNPTQPFMCVHLCAHNDVSFYGSQGSGFILTAQKREGSSSVLQFFDVPTGLNIFQAKFEPQKGALQWTIITRACNLDLNVSCESP